MKYDRNVGRNPIPQITKRVGGSSVATSVMAMISYFGFFGVKWLKTNMTNG